MVRVKVSDKVSVGASGGVRFRVRTHKISVECGYCHYYIHGGRVYSRTSCVRRTKTEKLRIFQLWASYKPTP